MLENGCESAIALESTITGQFLGKDGAPCSNGFLVCFYAMFNAQTVDIGIVGGAMVREILAQIGAVGA